MRIAGLVLAGLLLVQSKAVDAVQLSCETRLPAWQPSLQCERILAFLERATDIHSDSFVAPENRIAVLDHDGTLWAEKPHYIQIGYMLSLLQQQDIARRDPRLTAFMKGDKTVLAGLSHEQMFELFMRPAIGMPLGQYKQGAYQFVFDRTGMRSANELANLRYQPMLELIQLLKNYAFRVYIVTGGDEDFVKALSQPLYGVDERFVIGTRTRNNICPDSGEPCKTAEILGEINEGLTKVRHIEEQIGKRPLIAVGNSDGDLEMLLAAQPHGLAILLLHDDAQREWAYSERAGSVQAVTNSETWLRISMQQDFKTLWVDSAPITAEASLPE